MMHMRGILVALLLLGAGIFGVQAAGGNTVVLPDSVVLFGAESVQVDEGTNVLGGDTATNSRAQIGRDSFLEDSLLADDAHFSQDVTIVGNLEADNVLGSDPSVQGEIITPRVTDDYELPTLPSIQPGKDDIRIKKGETATLQPGSYRHIIIDRGANVVFEPGTYNAQRFHVGQGSILAIGGTTIFNIKNNFFIGSDTTIDLATDLETSDLTWNYAGHGAAHIGSGTFGAGIVTAPNTTIQLGKAAIWRGRLIAKRVTVGKGAIVSADIAFNVPSSVDAVIADPDGGFVVVNEILVNLEEDAPLSSLESILDEINGTIVGHIDITNEYKIRIQSNTPQELNDAIAAIEALGAEGVQIVSKNGLVFPN